MPAKKSTKPGKSSSKTVAQARKIIKDPKLVKKAANVVRKQVTGKSSKVNKELEALSDPRPGPEPGAIGIFKVVEIESLVPSKTNPRKTFNHIDELAESIKSNGLINPLTVRSVEDYYEIICGERRYKAAQIVGLATVPVIIRELTDDEVLEVQIVENLQRSDVHPLDEAEGFKNLLDSGKYNITSLAERIGRSAHYVYNRLQLNSLIDPIREALSDDYITISHCLLLANLSPDMQTEVFAEIDNRKAIYGRKEADSISNLKDEIIERMLLLSKAPFDITKANLIENAGACRDCLKCTGNNIFLFAELNVKQESKCTDKKCWDMKVEAHIQVKKEAFQKKEKPVVLISKDYTVSPEEKDNGVIGVENYEIASNKKCENTVDAIYTDGDKAGKTTKVCTDPNCKVHHPYGNFGSSSSGQKKDPNETYARRVELALEPLELEMINECAKVMITGIYHGEHSDLIFDFSFTDNFSVLLFAISQAYQMMDGSKQGLLVELLQQVNLIPKEPGEVIKPDEEEAYEKFVEEYLDDDYNSGDEEFSMFLFRIKRGETAGLERLLLTMLAISKLHTIKDGCLRGRSQNFYEMMGKYIPVESIYENLSKPYNEKIEKMQKNFIKTNGKSPEMPKDKYDIKLKHTWANAASLLDTPQGLLGDRRGEDEHSDQEGDQRADELGEQIGSFEETDDAGLGDQ